MGQDPDAVQSVYDVLRGQAPIDNDLMERVEDPLLVDQGNSVRSHRTSVAPGAGSNESSCPCGAVTPC
jgi:hypothetical protein